MSSEKITFKPLATNLVDCKENKNCEQNIIYNPQKLGEKCGRVHGKITRICDTGLNCKKEEGTQFSRCAPLDAPCTNCSKYRLCNSRDDSNCVTNWQECRPYPHTNYQQCDALFKP